MELTDLTSISQFFISKGGCVFQYDFWIIACYNVIFSTFFLNFSSFIPFFLTFSTFLEHDYFLKIFFLSLITEYKKTFLAK